MRLAIQHENNSFSNEWIKYCQEHNIDYKLVNCYDFDIIKQLEDCDGLMWHWSQVNCRAILFARQLIYSLEHRGIKVYPNSRTCWHFDDKVGEKYLFDCIDAPLVPSFVFYDKRKAVEWANNTNYPKVFKLRCGASGVNVKLNKNKNQAIKYIKLAFGKGFPSIDKISRLKDKRMRFRQNRNFINFLLVLKGYVRLLFPSYDDRMLVPQKGYIYFQDFIPNNKYDIRVLVIGDKAFAKKRIARKNDFRASGSGVFDYNQKEMSVECIKIAFECNEKLKMQSVGFDFILSNGSYLLLEMSYAFISNEYNPCGGYWDKNLKFHEGNFIPEKFIIEDFIGSLNLK